MKLETVVKLIKDKTNMLGYAKSEDIINSLRDNYKQIEMRISIVREPDCEQTNREIFDNIIIPLIKAKECLYRESLETLYVYSRNLIRLRILNRACCLINGQMSQKYKFTVMTNYDIIREEQGTGELS